MTRHFRCPAACAALLLATLSACVPIPAHGPRVEPGGAFSGAAGYTVSPPSCSAGEAEEGRSGCSERIRGHLGPAYLGGRYGWVLADSASALSVGVNLPLPPLLALLGGHVDLFYQPARGAEGTLDRGFGTLIGPRHLTPYAQLGRSGGRGGWYTTQALTLPTPAGDGRLVWAPSLSRAWKQGVAGRATTTLHLIGHLGVEVDGGPRRRLFGLTAAASVDLR